MNRRDYRRQLGDALDTLHIEKLLRLTGHVELATLQVYRRHYGSRTNCESFHKTINWTLPTEAASHINSFVKDASPHDKVRVVSVRANWYEWNQPASRSSEYDMSVEGGIEAHLKVGGQEKEYWLYLQFGCRHSLEVLNVNRDLKMATCTRCGQQFRYSNTPGVD